MPGVCGKSTAALRWRDESEIQALHARLSGDAIPFVRNNIRL